MTPARRESSLQAKDVLCTLPRTAPDATTWYPITAAAFGGRLLGSRPT
jgi:hypothetical protein